ncbi:hypothetical protein Vafri_21443, partial [Volvox africanus]
SHAIASGGTLPSPPDAVAAAAASMTTRRFIGAVGTTGSTMTVSDLTVWRNVSYNCRAASRDAAKRSGGGGGGGVMESLCRMPAAPFPPASAFLPTGQADTAASTS